MAEQSNTYLAIDLKSFYASVECVERKLNPLTTNLVVADVSRTEKTICLAVSPSLKAYGIPGRARLFEVVQRVREVNRERQNAIGGKAFKESSCDAEELMRHPEYELSYIAAPPRMAFYLDYSTRIYQIYLRYVAPEDMHVYSIDEVFLDVTQYLGTYKLTARELAGKLIREILAETGITATAGIGTNLYLCKVAMDIVAKHVKPDENGVRIAELNERTYREKLWSHQPLTDFWRVGHGYAKKLNERGLYTMGDIARCSVGKPGDFYNEEMLYKLFGINAELLIDHAWGYEPVTMKEIKAYRPETNCMSSGQVLTCAYDAAKAKLVTKEMADFLALDLVEKRMVTDQLVLTIGYDIDNLKAENNATMFHGEVTTDRYGRQTPKQAHGTVNLKHPSSSSRMIIDAVAKLYDEIVDPLLLVRRITVNANHLIREEEAKQKESYEQLSLFDEPEQARMDEQEEQALAKERKMQEAMLAVKKKFGKNAMIKGMNMEEGATGQERNRQIGGHKA